MNQSLHRMKSAWFRFRIGRHLDRRQPLSEPLRTVIANDADLAKWYEIELELRRRLRDDFGPWTWSIDRRHDGEAADRSVDHSHDGSAVVSASVVDESAMSDSEQRSRTRLYGWMAIAATVVVAVGLSWRTEPKPTVAPEGSYANVDPTIDRDVDAAVRLEQRDKNARAIRLLAATFSASRDVVGRVQTRTGEIVQSTYRQTSLGQLRRLEQTAANDLPAEPAEIVNLDVEIESSRLRRTGSWMTGWAFELERMGRSESDPRDGLNRDG